MSILLAILGGLCSAATVVGSLLKPLAPYLVLVGMGFVLCLLLSHEGCSCRRHREPRPPRSWSFEVDSVENGATIIVKTGLRERRTAAVTLADIVAPADGQPLAEQSRANLQRLAGRTVRVEHDGLLRRGPMVGTVYGQSGAVLQEEQLRAGLARALDGAPAGWRGIEAEARGARRGLWATNE
jgi:endonuclease YncB( thermonuclease family)